MTSDQIAEIRARAEAATAGPWEVQDGCSWRRIGTRGHSGNVLCPTNSRSDNHPDLTAGRGEDLSANLAFIAHARTDIPALCTALEAETAAHKEQHDIVARIWKLLGSPTYDELQGDSIYDVIEKRFAVGEKAEAHAAALAGALEGVVAVADRNTPDFRAARQALSAYRGG